MGSICKKYIESALFKAYILSKNCAFAVTIIDNNCEFDGILESMNLDEYERMDLPMEQHDHSLHEHTGVGMAPILATKRTLGPHRVKKVH